METIGNPKFAENEGKRTYRVWQLPGLSVVENLDYPEKEERESILEVLRSNPLGKNFGFNALSKKIQNIQQNGSRSFFIKMKSNPVLILDYIHDRNGRSHMDFENSMYGDFKSKRAQFTRAGVLSEIIISKRIKNIIASNEVQELARKYGFDSMIFAEPIFALTVNESSKKALIYKNTKWKAGSAVNNLEDLTQDLRKIFLRNGIRPGDLNPHQFMVTEEDGKLCIVLIDVESYVETEKIEQA